VQHDVRKGTDKKMSKSEYRGILHVFAQQFEHDDAFLVGTREGLEVLRDAINASLENSHGAAHSFTGMDGEGYVIHCFVQDAAQMDQLLLPYTDPRFKTYAGWGEGCATPWDLLKASRENDVA
jgi:hypothetical protein